MPHPHTHALARDALSREAIRGEPALFVRRSSRRRGSSVLGGRCVFNTCNCSKKHPPLPNQGASTQTQTSAFKLLSAAQSFATRARCGSGAGAHDGGGDDERED